MQRDYRAFVVAHLSVTESTNQALMPLPIESNAGLPLAL